MNAQNNTTLFSQLQSWAGFIFPSLAILFIYMPKGDFSPIGLLVAILILYTRRADFSVNSRLKIVCWLFIAYLIFFTLTSENIPRSIKGLYDMLRGILLFPVALLWVNELRSRARYNALFILVSMLIIGNLFFARPEGFYGYHPNPNNTGVTLWIFAIFAFFGMSFTPRWSNFSQTGFYLINLLAGALSLYLILLTNARGVWLALVSGALIVLFAMPQLKKSQKLLLSATVSGIFLALFLFANFKGDSLSRRQEIWIGLFKHSVNDHLWLGYGLNVVKDVLSKYHIIEQTAHNIFLEIFASTGVIGLVIFMSMLVWTIRLYWQQRYTKGPIFYLGIAGLTGLFAMAMFDLKFSGFRLIGMAFFFAGLIYSQRLADTPNDCKMPTSLA